MMADGCRYQDREVKQGRGTSEGVCGLIMVKNLTRCFGIRNKSQQGQLSEKLVVEIKFKPVNALTGIF